MCAREVVKRLNQAACNAKPRAEGIAYLDDGGMLELGAVGVHADVEQGIAHKCSSLKVTVGGEPAQSAFFARGDHGSTQVAYFQKPLAHFAVAIAVEQQ